MAIPAAGVGAAAMAGQAGLHPLPFPTPVLYLQYISGVCHGMCASTCNEQQAMPLH